jgi:hypothetical protein
VSTNYYDTHHVFFCILLLTSPLVGTKIFSESCSFNTLSCLSKRVAHASYKKKEGRNLLGGGGQSTLSKIVTLTVSPDKIRHTQPFLSSATCRFEHEIYIVNSASSLVSYLLAYFDMTLICNQLRNFVSLVNQLVICQLPNHLVKQTDLYSVCESSETIT